MPKRNLGEKEKFGHMEELQINAKIKASIDRFFKMKKVNLCELFAYYECEMNCLVCVRKRFISSTIALEKSEIV